MHEWPQQPQRGALGGAEKQRLEKLAELRNLPPTGVNFMPYNDRYDRSH